MILGCLKLGFVGLFWDVFG